MKRLFIDLDGTLARFHDEAMYLERMYEEDFFRELKPFENMVNGIKEFIKMHPEVDVYTLSSTDESKYCCAEKNDWLDKYLPEINNIHRLFTSINTPKAEFVKNITGIAVTKDDVLVDDYNKGVYDWEEAGGTAVKCHNNINHKGLGLHGGQKGNVWTKAIVHTEDLPIMIASELSAHMELHFDFKPIFEAYEITNTNITLCSTEIGGNPVYTWKENGDELDWNILRKHANPLDAIRFIRLKGNFSDFEPVLLKIETSDLNKNKDFCTMPRHKYNAIIFNYNNKTIPAPEFWKEVLNNSHLLKFKDSALATLPKLSLNNMLIKAENQKNSHFILVCDDEGKINGSLLNRAIFEEPKDVEMTYGEMTGIFRENERNGGDPLTGYIVFAEDSFTAPYSEEERTYAISSHNKAYMPNMGGYSIFGSSLDGTDKDVHLEAYMANEKGGKDGWKIERCYMKEYTKKIVKIIAGKCFICDVKGENFCSLSPEMTEKYMNMFKYPEIFLQTGKEIKAIPYNPESVRKAIKP